MLKEAVERIYKENDGTAAVSDEPLNPIETIITASAHSIIASRHMRKARGYIAKGMPDDAERELDKGLDEIDEASGFYIVSLRGANEYQTGLISRRMKRLLKRTETGFEIDGRIAELATDRN